MRPARTSWRISARRWKARRQRLTHVATPTSRGAAGRACRATFTTPASAPASPFSARSFSAACSESWATSSCESPRRRFVEVATGRAPVDRTLLSVIPKPIQAKCRAKERLTRDFDWRASVCPIGNRARAAGSSTTRPSRVDFMDEHFNRRVLAEEILVSGEDFRPVRHCGRPPAAASTGVVLRRPAGHEPVQARRDAEGTVHLLPAQRLGRRRMDRLRRRRLLSRLRERHEPSLRLVDPPGRACAC